MLWPRLKQHVKKQEDDYAEQSQNAKGMSEEGQPNSEAAVDKNAAHEGVIPAEAPAFAEQPQKSNVWYSHSAEDVLIQFGSSPTGLSAEEAAQRLAADGPNELFPSATVRIWCSWAPASRPARHRPW